MSTYMLPSPAAMRKTQEWAARLASDTTPGTVYRLNEHHYIIKHFGEMTGTGPRAYFVSVEREQRATWECSACGPRRFRCASVYAVMRIEAARQEALHFGAQNAVPVPELLAYLRDYYSVPDLDLDTREQIGTYINALSVPPIVVSLRYWWPDWQPERMLDELEGIASAEPRELEVRWGGRLEDWRPARAGVDEIRDYVNDRGLTPGAVILEPRSRRTGGWEGRYHIHLVEAAA